MCTNFDFIKFGAKAKIFGSTCHQIPVEAHWSIEKVEKYYGPIRQAYDIIQAKIRGKISKNAILQIAFKAVNNTIGSNGLVATFLVFGAYFCIFTNFLPSTSQQQQINAMIEAMSELRKLKAQRRVQNTSNARNDPDIIQTLLLVLSLSSKVWIYQEKKRWTKLFNVLDIADTNIIINTGSSPVIFRNTHVKPYHSHIEETNISYPKTINDPEERPTNKPANEEIFTLFDYPES